MSTAETTPAERARQIHARIAEIAPYPETAEATTAQNLARWLAVRAAVINHQQLSPEGTMSRGQVDLLTILFAASHALYALDASGPVLGTQVAREIWHAWDDGQGVGEWLWDHLGTSVCTELGPLADELAALQKLQSPPEGLLAHADPIRSALRQAHLSARSVNGHEAYMRALIALDDELGRKQDAAADDGPCCTGCGPDCGCGGTPHEDAEAGR